MRPRPVIFELGRKVIKVTGCVHYGARLALPRSVRRRFPPILKSQGSACSCKNCSTGLACTLDLAIVMAHTNGTWPLGNGSRPFVIVRGGRPAGTATVLAGQFWGALDRARGRREAGDHASGTWNNGGRCCAPRRSGCTAEAVCCRATGRNCAGRRDRDGGSSGRRAAYALA